MESAGGKSCTVIGKLREGGLHSTGVWRGTVEEEAEVKEHMIKKAISELKISRCDI